MEMKAPLVRGFLALRLGGICMHRRFELELVAHCCPISGPDECVEPGSRVALPTQNVRVDAKSDLRIGMPELSHHVGNCRTGLKIAARRTCAAARAGTTLRAER
jgi:hypothetical protein